MSIFKKIFESNDLDINEDVQLNEYGFSPRKTNPSNNQAKRNFKKSELETELGSERNINGPSEKQMRYLYVLKNKHPEEFLKSIQLYGKTDIEEIKSLPKSKVSGIIDFIKQFTRERYNTYKYKESENKMKSWKEKLFESTGLGLPIMESLMDDDEWGYEEEEQEFEEAQERTPEERQIIDKAVQDIHTDKLQVQDVLPRVPEHLRDDVLDELRNRGES